jgi:exodeoxyribonuclease VII large subunit
MELIEAAGSNAPEYSVSEISGAMKRLVENGFGRVRVRGELGRVSRPGSGHLYLDLKDDRAVLAACVWKGTVRSLGIRPEEGMEVIATGRLTTFPGQSKYQMIIEEMAPAGLGALMAMLEKRKAALAAEGLFDPGRKRPPPFLPEVVGVVTSPSGAVIRDILHRLAERFPRRVLLWPVTVQGERCAEEVAAAIRGFNALEAGGPTPRPDVIIVARGGGSIEDLWGFNEEIVVRAAAESAIPLISAVGHETDTTLIDLAADLRAPTPTAAAEMAVPVRLDLLARVAGLEERRAGCFARSMANRRQRLRDLARCLPRPEALVREREQMLDACAMRLPQALRGLVREKRMAFAAGRAGRFGPESLAAGIDRRRFRLEATATALRPQSMRRRLERLDERLETRGGRLDRAARQISTQGAQRLASLARTLATLDWQAVLARGYALVRDDAGAVLARAASVRPAARLSLQFADGSVEAVAAGDRPRRGRAAAKPEQQRLL